MFVNKLYFPASPEPLALPVLPSMPAPESDFLPELCRRRLVAQMISHHGELMSKKTSSTSDARQKRES